MDNLLRDLVVGAIGSVIGALLVFLGSKGLRFSQAAREKQNELRTKEENDWKTNETGIRQGITNFYLFEILKWVLFGNIFLAVPTLCTFLDITSNIGFITYRIILSFGGGFALVSYFYGLGRVMRYLKLRSLDI